MITHNKKIRKGEGMKYIYQFGVIAAITFIGELLRKVIDLPIPASVWGLVLMLLLLVTGMVKLEQVKEAGEFLIQIMPLMFVPAAVGLMVSWPELKSMLLPLIIIVIVTTIIVMAVSGKVTQFVIERQREQDE
jgi:holin-like protein